MDNTVSLWSVNYFQIDINNVQMLIQGWFQTYSSTLAVILQIAPSAQSDMPL